jgi:hypothetical protein
MDSEKVMEIVNHDAASDEHRRLLEGERVEVCSPPSLKYQFKIVHSRGSSALEVF